MDAERKRRIEQAKTETLEALARATRYSLEFQDKKLVDFYHKHIKKLDNMLKECD